jgi:hypothetical protein
MPLFGLQSPDSVNEVVMLAPNDSPLSAEALEHPQDLPISTLKLIQIPWFTYIHRSNYLDEAAGKRSTTFTWLGRKTTHEDDLRWAWQQDNWRK